MPNSKFRKPCKKSNPFYIERLKRINLLKFDLICNEDFGAKDNKSNKQLIFKKGDRVTNAKLK